MMMGRSLHSRAYARKYKKRFKFYLIGGLFLLVLLLVCSWWVTNRSPLVLSGVDVTGARAVPVADIERVASALLNTRVLLWSKNNALLAPRSAIERHIREEFGWVKQAHVEVSGISRLAVSVEEYDPKYRVCESLSDATCMLADETGYVFTPAVRGAGEDLLLFIVSDDDMKGSDVLPEAEFSEVVDFAADLQENDIEVMYVTLKDAGETVFTISYNTDVIIDRREESTDMLGHFLLLLARETEVYQSRDAFLRDTEYIDVRYGNKVFYKSHGETENE